MYNLKDLDRWLPIGKTAYKFPNENRRYMRLEVLAEEPANLYVHYGRETHFIGGFEGYDVVQFEVPGVFTITAKGGQCKIWTPELESAGAIEIPEAVSFTKIMTRRTRNPELEAMMHKVQQNMERRIEQVERDVNLRVQNERRIQEQADNRAAVERARREEAERSADGDDTGEDEAAE